MTAPWIRHAAVRNRGLVIVFAGPRRTIAAEHEPIVGGESVPIARPGTAAAVQELAYRHGDYAIAGVAAQVAAGVSGRPNDVRLALVDVDAMPIRAQTAEAIAINCQRALKAAARMAAREPGAVSDAAVSAGYRGALDAAFLFAEGIAVDTPVRP